MFEHFIESDSHLGFESGEPVFDSSFADEVFILERHDFAVFGYEGVGLFGEFGSAGGWHELHSLKTIEAISDELANLGWVGSVGQDGK